MLVARWFQVVEIAASGHCAERERQTSQARDECSDELVKIDATSTTPHPSALIAQNPSSELLAKNIIYVRGTFFCIASRKSLD